jgi:uncharacterized membrane protein YgcG
MRHLSRVLLIAALAALAVPALASAAPSPTSGTVVQRDVRAGALVLATHTGALQRVQLAKPNRFAMGAVVQVRGSNVRVVGHAHSAKIHGVVLQSAHGSYTLAGNGSVLAVSTATPPPVGQPVTATVQVSPTALSCDHAHMQVGDTQAPSAELRGTVLSQDATTLRLSVFGFTSGLAIALGGQTIPTLAVGTQVEARVSLGPDPANPSGIVLTLVALRVDDNNNNDDEQGSFVKAEGQVTAVTEAGPTGGAVGSITIAGEQGDVTFVIPAGFGATGAVVGDEVEARGTAAATPDGQPTLVRLEGKDDGHGQFGGHHHQRGSGDGSGGGSGNWGGGGGSDGGSGGDN